MKAEAAFETKVLNLAKRLHWRAHTERASLSKSGKHHTAVRGDTGYPDVTLTHPKLGAFWLELKAGYAMPSGEQCAWVRDLPPLRAFVVNDAGFYTMVQPLLERGEVDGIDNSSPLPVGLRLGWDGVNWFGPIAAKAQDLWEDHMTGGVTKWQRDNAKANAKALKAAAAAGVPLRRPARLSADETPPSTP